MVEGPALEKRYPVKKRDRGFESHPLRQSICPRWPVADLLNIGSLAPPNLRGGYLISVCGEMSELAEGARLEIVCAAKSGTEGSNPSLSAIASIPFTCDLARKYPVGRLP